jgi:hypothetical protein
MGLRCPRIYDLESGHLLDAPLLSYSNGWFGPVEFSKDGKCLAYDFGNGNSKTLWGVGVLALTGNSVARRDDNVGDSDAREFPLGGTPVAFVGDGCRLAYTGLEGEITVEGAPKETYRHNRSQPTAMGFSADGTRFSIAHRGGEVTIWRRGASHYSVLVTWLLDGHWLVTTPSGLYDSSSPGDLPGVSWVLPSDPLTPLPVEAFMREYYEPGLLGKVLRGEPLREVKALGELKRVQPEVRVVSVTPEGDDRQVTVEVEVAQGCREVGVGEQAQRVCTNQVQDLRLFRDGQLVGYEPKTSGAIALTDGKARITFEGIKIPTDGREALEFSAYAFNEDWVKSLTAKHSYPVPKGLTPRKPRAYVVSIGMNAYENAAWDLTYAANDAREMQRLVSESLAGSGKYAAVVRVPLISEPNGDLRITKAKVRTVFELLAGHAVSEQAKAAIPNVEQLQAAQPEDVLIISYSGHGVADGAGQFYLYPHDLGLPTTPGERGDVPFARLISSEELSLWLRDVDAGEMTFILDACQSAASVAGAGFRPGPMGSRGLGQLAYDKGMRILAASQAEQVALENDQLRHGMLSYALLREGLEAQQADFEPKDAQILAGEWLNWGVQRVPQLYGELAAGTFKSRSGFQRADVAANTRPPHVQQPTLFDFKRAAAQDLRMR